MATEWNTSEVAKLTGLTSRTLRHYDHIRLLEPTRRTDSGSRLYDANSLVRLQRILMLRQLGLGLGDIRRFLGEEVDQLEALEGHSTWIRSEITRLRKQLGSIASTMQALRNGDTLMAKNMFDGFDTSRFREEVETRWGTAAYASGDAWWQAKSPGERDGFRSQQEALTRDWLEAFESGESPRSPRAHQLARRHFDWVTSIPGTPGFGGDPTLQREYCVGLGEMYVLDERFAAHYGGDASAQFVRDSMVDFAATL